MNNEQHFSNAQRNYDNMMPEDNGEVVEEMDCPECDTEVDLWYGKGTCPKCGNECELDED